MAVRAVGRAAARREEVAEAAAAVTARVMVAADTAQEVKAAEQVERAEATVVPLKVAETAELVRLQMQPLALMMPLK